MQVEAEIRELGGEATYRHLDVTSESDWESLVQSALDQYGKIDVLVNNAGVVSRGTLEDTTVEEWDRVMDINAKGVFLGTKSVIDPMRQNGGGSIVNLASIIGLVGYAQILNQKMNWGFNPYAASKGGVVQFTRNLAVAYAHKNIRVNCICPGYTETNMTESMTDDPKMRQILTSLHPMGRLGQAEEIAYAALYLASDESSYVTGTPLAVDGGYTAQ